MVGLLSHQGVGGTQDGLVRLVVYIEVIQVVWVCDNWVFIETGRLPLEEHINNGDLGYFG